MAPPRSVFPIREDVDADASPTAAGLEDADGVVDALASDTARAMVEHLYTEPATASDLAAAVGTSVQNARYHLERLEAAGVVGVVGVVGSWCSERSTEMDVYGLQSEPLVVVAGGPGVDETVRSLLTDASD